MGSSDRILGKVRSLGDNYLTHVRRLSSSPSAESEFRQWFSFRGDKKNISWFPGHMIKGLRQMRKALIETDCVVEVHDARIPLTGRNINFQHDITGNKPHILVLNKKDLVFNPESDGKSQNTEKRTTDYLQQDIRERILKHEPNLSDVIFTNCKNVRCEGLQSVLPTAVKLITENERFNRKFSPDSNLLICGIPNVGKSSLINLLRSATLNLKGKPMKVGAKPGITRALQTKIRVSDDPLVFLLDTPGIMMPNIRNIETGMKLASCATLLDSQVGIINIADYILYQLNKNDRFDYVDLMCLEEPYDDIIDMLTSSAKAQNKFRTVNRRIVGGMGTEVPDVMFAAEKFVKAFRASELGMLILDIDMIS